ncbi:hypothetical protein EST38_g6573 [Candolleomyces aberdarensis]|uniref:Beta-lactamase-related domain-containing protein n=1 Tax=Candolleomyces aberdarensis TaxID=2316362 RepID=A0A4Q2DKA6_9AGAR|nr:hypothetical protein EST38_g6573 [Candolleomyces aberdarensis]
MLASPLALTSDTLQKEKAEKSGKLPSFIYGVTNLEEEIYFKASGNLDFHDPTSPPLTPDSTLWICSMTKLTTAIATHQLIERGLLSYDTPVSKFIPEFATPVILDPGYKKPNAKLTYKFAKTPITVFHLMNHTSGVYYALRTPNPPFALADGYILPHDKEDPHQGFIKIVKKDFPGIPLKFEPGTSWGYGWSSDFLGIVISRVTGQTLEEYFQENIFKPLGVKMSFYLDPEFRKNLLQMTYSDPDGKILPWSNRTTLIEQDPEKGIGSYSSMRDYLTLLRHVLRLKAGLPVDKPLISQKSAESLFQPTLTPAGSKALDHGGLKNLQFSTGVALTTEDWPGMRKKGSAWWFGWAGTTYFLDPTTGIAVVVGTQLVPASNAMVQGLAMKLERTLYANLEYTSERAHKL